MLGKKWEIRLLGNLEARNGSTLIQRFSTKHIAILLAYLSRRLDHKIPRDQLADLLWPDSEPDRGRQRLRVALASLRGHLEPLGVAPGSVIDADREGIGLRSQSCLVDANEFWAKVNLGLSTTSQPLAIELLRVADKLYQGPFGSGPKCIRSQGFL